MIVTRLYKNIVVWRMMLNSFSTTWRHVKNPLKAIQVQRELMKLLNEVLGGRKPQKIVKVNGRYFWDINTPGFPSIALSNNLRGEVNRIMPSAENGNCNRFRVVMIGITKKCPLQCEHCYEWDALNQKEVLSLDELKSIVKKFQLMGVGQIQLGGGEPLWRFNDLIEVLKSSEKTSDFWITTSGFMLTEEKALKLKNAGLTGVSISMDHFIVEKHNKFRGHKDSYEWVQKAIVNCSNAGLLVSVSICATNEFISKENIYAYAETVKKSGVPFMQIIEPRQAGRYSGKDVHLTNANIKILEDFFFDMNFNPVFRKHPIVIYHGYYQRSIGCFGAGSRYLYVDTDGDIHACPFCRSKSGNVLSDEVEQCVEKLKSAGGCNIFEDSLA